MLCRRLGYSNLGPLSPNHEYDREYFFFLLPTSEFVVPTFRIHYILTINGIHLRLTVLIFCWVNRHIAIPRLKSSSYFEQPCQFFLQQLIAVIDHSGLLGDQRIIKINFSLGVISLNRCHQLHNRYGNPYLEVIVMHKIHQQSILRVMSLFCID